MVKEQIKFQIFIVMLVLVMSVISASMLIPANDKAEENSKAPENSRVISETEAGEWELERVDFIHYAKPENPRIENKGPKEPSCYKLMGVKWKTLPVNYVINPNNPHGMSEEFVTSTISTSAETWDDATSTELFNNTYSIDYSAHYGIQDYVNTIDFNDYSNDNVIAVTSVWYMRKARQIVEFDMRLNTRFNWGDATANSSVMDLQNIATHELGHSVGLDDIYSASCNYVTMYGYSTEGETSKRTLEQPDITGLQKMYSS